MTYDDVDKIVELYRYHRVDVFRHLARYIHRVARETEPEDMEKTMCHTLSQWQRAAEDMRADLGLGES